MTTTIPPRFRITKRITFPIAGSATKGSIQFFPWTLGADHKVFNGKWHTSDRWRAMVVEFSDAFAMVDGKHLYIHTKPKFTSCFPLNAKVLQKEDTPQVAWALRSSYPFDPIVLVADNRRILVFNVRQKRVVGLIRGHGGRITSIAVHPSSPNIFATTSSDFTTRIYNLDHKVSNTTENPIWEPWDEPSSGSAAHGTDGSDSTGSGIGYCFQILIRGSGGHAWDVLGAAFHPHLPLIATCGADRYVKIWRIFSDKCESVFREDKPLFSARITTSRVLSIAWLGEDVLLMHTAATWTPIRTRPEDTFDEDGFEDTIEIGAGTIDIFQWLGLKRFFPNGLAPDPVLRGGSSDYQESKSYTLIATQHLAFPQQQIPIEPISTISHPRMLHGRFLFVYPDSKDIVLLDVSKLASRTLPTNTSADPLVEMTKRIRLDESASPSPSGSVRGTPFAEHLFQFDDFDSGVDIAACALAPSGAVVILGSKGRMWFLTREA
ncbi:Coatomer beta subunit [Mycena venus]|uniref:Coatomer beta subunit n=1 Tax=Mycena venus TaxID=2733690 RepID=A0A8H7CUH3_9AGAR|nr:Coatomer beta subunit [Mycena venus]